MSDRETEKALTSEQLEKAKDAIEYLSSLKSTTMESTENKALTRDRRTAGQGRTHCSRPATGRRGLG